MWNPQQHMSKPKTLNAKVKLATFTQSGTYNDQVRRPLTSELTDNTIARLEVATDHGRNITRAAVANIAASIIKPAAEIEGIAQVEHGWGESRASFMMEFMVPLAGGVSISKVMTGYTDYLGISGQGNFNPNLRLYINSITNMRTAMRGSVAVTTPIQTQSLLTGHYTPGGTIPNEFSMRPLDVFTQLSSSVDVANYAAEGIISDRRSTFASGPKMSDRSHTFTAAYVSKMLQSGQEAQRLQEDGIGDLTRVYAQAAGIAGENSIADDVVLDALFHASPINFRQFGFVTWAELVKVFPDIDSKTQVIFTGGVHAKASALPHQRGQTEYWHGNTQETLLATQITQTIPGLMMECLIGNIGLMITNNTPNGQPIVTVVREPLTLSENVDITYYVERLKLLIMTELVPGITFNNQANITVTIIADVYGETNLSISFCGGPVIDYAAPTFCDTRYTPLITCNQNIVNNMQKDFSNILANIGHGLDTPSHISHPFSSAFAPPPPSNGAFMPSMAHAPAAVPAAAPQIITNVGSSRWK